MASLDVKLTGPTTTGSVESHELHFARRALALLKNRLGNDGMMELLSTDIARADAYWERTVIASKGEFTETSTTINITGLNVKAFLGWFHAHAQDVPVMQAAHPEHYINTVGPILETIGDQPSFFHLQLLDQPAACVTTRDPQRYPMAMCGSATLRSGTVIGYACHQFREYDEQTEGIGFEVRFGAWLPKTCDEEVLETHRKHFAVEWTNWIRAAHEEIAAT